MIVQVKFNEISFANANEFPGHFSTKGPEGIPHSIREFSFHFLHFKVNDDLCRILAGKRRGNLRRIRELRRFLALGLLIDVVVARCRQDGS